VTNTARLPLGQAALQLGVAWHHLHRLAKRKLIPFEQCGHIRMVRAEDLDTIRQACARAGYIRTEAEKGETCAAR
jgi:hypothetical protein